MTDLLAVSGLCGARIVRGIRRGQSDFFFFGYFSLFLPSFPFVFFKTVYINLLYVTFHSIFILFLK